MNTQSIAGHDFELDALDHAGSFSPSDGSFHQRSADALVPPVLVNGNAQGGRVPRAPLFSPFAAQNADDRSPGLRDQKAGIRAGEIIGDPFPLFFNRRRQFTRPAPDL